MPLKHGHRRVDGINPSSEYAAWQAMKRRCIISNHPSYHNYGGRGINYCSRWEVFENFLSDIGKKPFPDMQLERINNEGDYSPSNCRWATKAEQSQNRRTNKLTKLEVNKIRMLYAEGYTQASLAMKFGVNQATISKIVNQRQWKEVM